MRAGTRAVQFAREDARGPDCARSRAVRAVQIDPARPLGHSNPMDHRLDLSGLKCPLPVLRSRKRLRAMAPGEELDVVCTDPMSAIDIPNMVRELGDELIEQRAEGGRLSFRIRKAST